MTAKELPRMDEDTRLEPILENLSQGFIAGIGSEWSTSENVGEGIRAEMVDELAHKHFPMCMRNLHENLKRNHHLKHFGRMQYGLFLKVWFSVIGRLGLTYQVVRRFWVCLSKTPSFSGASPSVFTPTMSSTKSTNTTSGIHMV
jgi:DNA primase large subunit